MALTKHDERVVRAWNRLQRNWWAYDEISDACAKQPRRAWRLLRRMADLASSAELIQDLGAGPLEDFIRSHAPHFIGQIERLAAEHARFRQALRCARLPHATDPVSARLFALGMDPVDVKPLKGWQAEAG
jgi:hypothetical protein